MRLFPWVVRACGALILLLLVQACGSDGTPEPLSFYLDPSHPGVDAAPDHHEAATQPAVCAPADPSAVPVPELAGPTWTATLETQKLSLYEGLVRATAFYANQPPLIADIVVCNGDYENPNIVVGLSNHHYSWSYTDPQDKPESGYIVNVHAVPTTSDLDERISDAVRKGARVRIWGFEVDRINYDNGSWWTDTGCNTLMITHFCLDN